MARQKKWINGMSVKLMMASEIPATARERLHLAADSTEIVEVYEYRRPTWEQHLRDETARQLAEAFEKEAINA